MITTFEQRSQAPSYVVPSRPPGIKGSLKVSANEINQHFPLSPGNKLDFRPTRYRLIHVQDHISKTIAEFEGESSLHFSKMDPNTGRTLRHQVLIPSVGTDIEILSGLSVCGDDNAGPRRCLIAQAVEGDRIRVEATAWSLVRTPYGESAGYTVATMGARHRIEVRECSDYGSLTVFSQRL